MAPITASCSQRVTRRCLLGVHFAFIAQVSQLLDQYQLSVSPFSTVVKRQISCSPAGQR